MYNGKFIIHNKTAHYKDYEIFEFIVECISKGLLSNNETEYCYCVVRPCEHWDLVFESHKTKKGYRYDGEVLTHTFDKDNVKELLVILDKGE